MSSYLDLKHDALPAGTESRALLVEDDPLVARAVTRILRRHGVEVTFAVTAADLAQLDGRYDVGIFDIDLPEADGIELAHLCTTKGLVGSVLFFSATENPRQIEAASQLGELFTKGEGIGPLVERVLAACRRPSGVYQKQP